MFAGVFGAAAHPGIRGSTAASFTFPEDLEKFKRPGCHDGNNHQNVPDRENIQNVLESSKHSQLL